MLHCAHSMVRSSANESENVKHLHGTVLGEKRTTDWCVAHTRAEHRSISIATDSSAYSMLACRPYVCRRTPVYAAALTSHSRTQHIFWSRIHEHAHIEREVSVSAHHTSSPMMWDKYCLSQCIQLTGFRDSAKYIARIRHFCSMLVCVLMQCSLEAYHISVDQLNSFERYKQNEKRQTDDFGSWLFALRRLNASATSMNTFRNEVESWALLFW